MCGEFTKDVILKIGKGFKTVKSLIASLKAEKVLLNSDLIKWLVEHGTVITKVQGIIPAKRGYPFKTFMDWGQINGIWVMLNYVMLYLLRHQRQ